MFPWACGHMSHKSGSLLFPCHMFPSARGRRSHKSGSLVFKLDVGFVFLVFALCPGRHICVHGLQEEVRQLDTTLSALPACLSSDTFRLAIFFLCLSFDTFRLAIFNFHYNLVFYGLGSGQGVYVAWRCRSRVTETSPTRGIAIFSRYFKVGYLEVREALIF